ncbi:MAG: hypothetical protein IJI59_00720, partial [Clostridia bacterium]|nr:hypothetical protein [Clostridia bacterium]
MKKKMGYRLLVLLICAVLFIGMVPAQAAETGSLTIRLPKEIYDQLPKDAVVEFTLKRIGTWDDGKGWVMDQELGNYGDKILGAEKTEQLTAIAKELAGKIGSLYANKGTPQTLEGGKTTFGNLGLGVYLYMMTQAPDMLKVDPYIVTIPRSNPATKEPQYDYEIEAKAEIWGSLIVEKNVVSELTSDHGLDFDFTVTLEDSTITGTYGGMKFDNGKAAFKLKDGQYRKATNLPVGVRYTVEETSAEGFTTRWSGETGAITAEGSLAVCTNTRDLGDLIVQKTDR